MAEQIIVILGEVGHAVGQRSWVLDLALAAARSVDPKDKTVSRPRVFGIIRRINSAGDSVLGYCREHAVCEIGNVHMRIPSLQGLHSFVEKPVLPEN
jgi:hypothetical protein